VNVSSLACGAFRSALKVEAQEEVRRRLITVDAHEAESVRRVAHRIGYERVDAFPIRDIAIEHDRSGRSGGDRAVAIEI